MNPTFENQYWKLWEAFVESSNDLNNSNAEAFVELSNDLNNSNAVVIAAEEEYDKEYEDLCVKFSHPPGRPNRRR